MDRSSRAALLGVAVSLGVHLAVALVLVRLPAPSETQLALARTTEVELVYPEGGATESATGTHGARAHTKASPLVPGGAPIAQNIDAENIGDRGDTYGASTFVLLLTRDDGITLQDSPMNAPRVSQTHRLDTARDRATQENRRATPHPEDTPFLASGTGEHRERRPDATTDARAGARDAPTASVLGLEQDRVVVVGSVHTPASAPQGQQPDRPMSSEVASTRGDALDSPGRGILRGTGPRATHAARVAFGRPPVDEGPAATVAVDRESRVRDDQDAELLAAHMVQSMVESTGRSGRQRGAGRGGVGGGGNPGSGGSDDEGGRSSAYAPGPGDYASLDTRDGRYQRWYLEQRRCVTRALVFPRERQLAMDQGTTVYRVPVRRNGTLAARPPLVRSSGFEDFDEAALEAIERCTPFAPIPSDLAPESQTIAVTMAIEFSNPMIQ